MYTDFDAKIKQDVFKEKTTYRETFKWFPNISKNIQNWQRDRTEKPAKPSAPYIYTDHETYLPWKKGAYVPFNRLWEPKPIIGQNPYDTFKMPVEEIEDDLEKDEVMKTRPRLYMSPAVSMDDVPDPDMRKLLCKHMYTSEWQKCAEDAAMGVTKKPTPTTTVERKDEGDNLISLQVDLIEPLAPHFRGKGRDWDLKQLRGSVDPTVAFWINKDPPVKCGACIDPLVGLVDQSTKKEIRDLIKQDKLRLAHDRSIPGYAGYKPLLSKGVSLSKVDLPVTHPFVSVTQAITKRYAEDYLPK